MKHLFRLFSCLVLLLICIDCTCQVPPCNTIKIGHFYTYPKNSAAQYKSERDAEWQKDINIKTGLFSMSKVKWESECVYSLKYESGTEVFTESELGIVKKNKFISEIKSVTDNYYTYEAHLGKLSNPIISADTVWRIKKENPTDNTLFSRVDENFQAGKKLDKKANYALLYVYRKKKFMCSKIDYVVYFNDNAMFASSNNAHFIFKIYKEGKYKLHGEFDNKNKELLVDIKFGNKYYVESGSEFWKCTLGSCCGPLLNLQEEDKALEDVDW